MTTEMPPLNPVANLDAALDRMEGNRRLLAQMIVIFREDAPELLRQIEEGIQLGDMNRVRRASHSLKGLAANFDGLRVVEIAAGLERDARSQAPEELASALERLHYEVHQLEMAIESFAEH